MQVKFLSDLNEDELLCKYNGVIKLSELNDKVPGTVYLTQIHIDVCCAMASALGFNGIEKMVYVNLLVKHSDKTRAVTALITLICKDKIAPIFINSSYVVKEILSRFLNVNDVIFSVNHLHAEELIGRRHFKRLAVKMIVHNIYRLFFKKMKCSSAVRSWVEITEMMYPLEFASSLILIYPFYLNISRHFKYIKSCFEKCGNVTLCGLPYSLWDYVKIIFIDKKKDLSCVRFECNAYNKHADELSGLGLKSLYTSDEFEAAAIVMVNALHKKSVKIVNTAHGMSFGCPYVKYDIFKVYNSAQHKYYGYESPEVGYTLEPRTNTDPSKCVIHGDSDRKAIVYLEANYEGLGMTYEAKLENRTIETLRELGEKYGFDVVVKVHPNRKVKGSIGDFSLFGVKTIKNLDELENTKLVFITFCSAAYYDFRAYGHFVFILDGFVHPEEIYGEKGLDCVSLDELEDVFKHLIAN